MSNNLIISRIEFLCSINKVNIQNEIKTLFKENDKNFLIVVLNYFNQQRCFKFFN